MPDHGIPSILPHTEEVPAVAGVPGASIGVVDIKKGSKTYHFGYRDVLAGLRLNDNTRRNINSLTKGILSALVGIEICENSTTLDWHSPIQTWLPAFSGITHEISTQTTLVDLLSHRTGVAGVDDLWMGAENVIYLDISEACRTFASLTQEEPFRTTFNYNNWGAEIVGQDLEASSARCIDELMSNRIFGPLNMPRTSITRNDTDDNEATS